MSSSIVTTTPYSPRISAWQESHGTRIDATGSRTGFFALTAVLTVVAFFVAGITGSSVAMVVDAALLMVGSLAGSLMIDAEPAEPAESAEAGHEAPADTTAQHDRELALNHAH